MLEWQLFIILLGLYCLCEYFEESVTEIIASSECKTKPQQQKPPVLSDIISWGRSEQLSNETQAAL